MSVLQHLGCDRTNSTRFPISTFEYYKRIHANPATEEVGNNSLAVWEEWGNALIKISAFLFSLAALCYGLSLRTWGNPTSAYLLIIAAFSFAATFIPVVDFYWHVLVRGIAFLFLGGVLMLATRQRVQEEWES